VAERPPADDVLLPAGTDDEREVGTAAAQQIDVDVAIDRCDVTEVLGQPVSIDQRHHIDTLHAW
jgi:hypothetical protein